MSTPFLQGNSKINNENNNIDIVPSHQQAYINNPITTNIFSNNSPPSSNINSNNTIRNLLALNSTTTLTKEYNGHNQNIPPLVAPSFSESITNHLSIVIGPKPTVNNKDLLTKSQSAALQEKPNSKLDNNNNSTQISALLNAVLAPNVISNSNTDLEIRMSNNSHMTQPHEGVAQLTGKKRGRKSNSLKAEEAAAAYSSKIQQLKHDEISFSEQQIVPTRTSNPSSNLSSPTILEQNRSFDANSKMQSILNKNSMKNLNRKMGNFFFFIF